MTEALKSGAISNNGHCVVIDSFGSLWHWKLKSTIDATPLQVYKVEEDLPFFVSVVVDSTFIFALDEHGDVWLASLDDMKFKQTKGKGIRSIYSSNKQGQCYGLDSDGFLLNISDTETSKVNENLPPLSMFSGGNKSESPNTGVDFDGRVWIWVRQSDNPKKIDFTTEFIQGAYSEGEIIKILTESGKIWKYYNDDVIDPLHHELPPLITVSVSGSHSIALTEDGEAYGWGSNNSGELGQPGRCLVYASTKIPDIPPINSAICGRNCSILIGKEGELLVLRGGIQKIEDIPTAFIRKRSAKSARK